MIMQLQKVFFCACTLFEKTLKKELVRKTIFRTKEEARKYEYLIRKVSKTVKF